MGPCGQLARTFGPLARLAAATGRVVNTFEPIARSDQFKEILDRVCEHRNRPRNAASRRTPHAAIADSAGLAENNALAAAAIRVPMAKNYTLMTGQIRHLDDMTPQVGLESTVK